MTNKNLSSYSKYLRKSFGKADYISMPNLMAVQKKSYSNFLQADITPDKRKNIGLQKVFNSIFPIVGSNKRASFEFISYDFDKIRFDKKECKRRKIMYSAPLKVSFRLVVWDVDPDTGSRFIRDIKEQQVYMGDMPLMTDDGTFIINGIERVVVSQVHRSPGVFFDHDKGKAFGSGRYQYSARVIPYRGSWLDFEFDSKDILYMRIDRKRKLPVTTLLYCLNSAEADRQIEEDVNNNQEINSSNLPGLSAEDILNYFYKNTEYSYKNNKWICDFDINDFVGSRINFDACALTDGKIFLKSGTKVSKMHVKEFSAIKQISFDKEYLIGQCINKNIIDPNSGEVYLSAGEEITEVILEKLLANNITNITTINFDNKTGSYIRDTLMVDKNKSKKDALLGIHRVIRTGELASFDAANSLFNNLFFNPNRYDLSGVGRMKLNQRLGISSEEVPESCTTLRKEDILLVIKQLIYIRNGFDNADDIDHLSNRRVRSVGELIENQYYLALCKVERSIHERLLSSDIDAIMPNDLINSKMVMATVREFVGSSQLSQFMDQSNPLSEITHKRRLSALGPGGLTRERAGFEVRDVHPTHYGRICPIETPDGQNVGLINSLATYARINSYGFIETPYRKIVNRKATDEIIYLSALEEINYNIVQMVHLDDDDMLPDTLLSCRSAGTNRMLHANDINLVDMSPRQLVSVASSLIPFLENDDANRALMGSNMQRQAVPLTFAKAPLVGTGMERIVGCDSSATILARRSGQVISVDSEHIIIKSNEQKVDNFDVYQLSKYQRSNQNTIINHKPIVYVDDIVEEGDIIADGSAIQNGELALGSNVVVAFMSWDGYNFEDSIIVSEALVNNDVFSSFYIEEFEVVVRDTKLGQEEVTRDIPNVSEEALRNLDESGIVCIGTQVKSRDIIVGKVTPRGETPSIPEEKLLRAIFGEKASDVVDSSMRIPSSISGTVIDVRIFSRRGLDKDDRSLAIEYATIEKHRKQKDKILLLLEQSLRENIIISIDKAKVVSAPKEISVKEINADHLNKLSHAQLLEIKTDNKDINSQIIQMIELCETEIAKAEKKFEEFVEMLQDGDNLQPGVLKIVQVFVATKRRLQTGDKMSGRHGNKGVISRVVPVEDMPYLKDGTKIDIILNPLGVPSRMNIGQILETHLGWACLQLGKKLNRLVDNKDLPAARSLLEKIYGADLYKDKFADCSDANIIQICHELKSGVPIAVPVFSGNHLDKIDNYLQYADIDTAGQMTLYDGRTGKKFDRKITVGCIYMLKLDHLIDDKMHARSVGPYSLVTQQPLGGKAQFGGQRFGEMEVWALEAYGAAYTLREMLTIKSDDVSGRSKVYEAIIKGENNFEIGMPESFNVLIKELRSLCLDVEMISSKEKFNEMNSQDQDNNKLIQDASSDSEINLLADNVVIEDDNNQVYIVEDNKDIVDNE